MIPEDTCELVVARYYDPATAQFLTVDQDVATTLSPYGYVAGNPLNGADPSGDCGGLFGVVCEAWDATAGQVVHYVQNHTIGGCVNAAAGFGVYGDATGCVALVGGHFTLIGTLGGGGGSPGASLTGGLLLSNASSPQQLSKGFAFWGGSADLGASIGDDFSVGQDACNNTIWENQVTAGLGVDLPIPFEFHGGASYTWVWSP